MRIFGCLLKMQISESSQDLLSHMVGPGICMLNKLSREFWCMLKFENLLSQVKGLTLPQFNLSILFHLLFCVSSFLMSLFKNIKKEGGGPKMVVEQDGETTSSPTNSSKEHSTKQLMNVSRGHQAPRKATHCLRKEVGKKYKRQKKRQKRQGGSSIPGVKSLSYI